LDGSQSRAYNVIAVKTGSPIACDLRALDEAQRRRRAELAERLQSSVREIISNAEGYSLRLAWNDKILLEVAEFISLKRRCCPFLNFQIGLGEGDDAITVSLSGRDGVKEFLAGEFGFDQAGSSSPK
jgi:hypothetical protein